MASKEAIASKYRDDCKRTELDTLRFALNFQKQISKCSKTLSLNLETSVFKIFQVLPVVEKHWAFTRSHERFKKHWFLNIRILKVCEGT